MTLIKSCPRPFSDHVVAEINGVELPIRIFPAANEARQGKKPWLFWVHGGGFVAGKHYIPNNWIHPAFHDLGMHVVTVSYRFIPQVDLPTLFGDIERSFTWCRSNLPSVLGEGEVDVDSWVSGGDSAGGHLACLSAIKFEPRPKVVLNLYGLVDLSDPYASEGKIPPSTFKYNTPLEVLGKAKRDRDPAHAKVSATWTWEMEPNLPVDKLRDMWGTDYTPSQEDRERMDLETYYGNTGTRIKAVFHLDDEDNDKSMNAPEYEQLKKAWSPAHLVKSEGGRYPPTVMMHGTADSAVPIQQSLEFADQLEKDGTEVIRIWCEGGEHCFEQVIGGPEDDGWDEYVVPCMKFVKKHLDLST